MKNFKMAILAIAVGAFIGMTSNQAMASGLGYINYQKVSDNFSYAQAAVKEIDAKALEMQQYMVDKEKQYKSLDTPLKKKNFEEVTAKEFNAKQEAFAKLKAQKEEAVYTKIQAATKQVLVEQKLDAVIDFRVIFIGGVDISDLVIDKLKTGKF